MIDRVAAVSNQISFFRSQLHLRRFDERTLRILESILVSKDVKSLLEIRNGLKKLLRSESVSFLQETAEKSVEQKLFVLEFFVQAFALVADVESCLALRYEALLLREHKSITDSSLQVTYEEWLIFAKDSLDNGFYSIAVKGCENAFSGAQADNDFGSRSSLKVIDAQVVEEIKKLKDLAVTLVASNSVQAQTVEHLKNKTLQQNSRNVSLPVETRCIASSMFRNGIKKRNMQKLCELQCLQRRNSEVYNITIPD